MTSDPRLLRPFVVLAEELHFGRAAERLHVTQPALSQQIRRLETQLGVSLFARTRSSVELTEAGEAVLVPARAAVEAGTAAEDTGRAFASGERGELRLGFSPGAHYVAQALLAEFGRRRPQVRVRAQQDNSGALAERVAGGDLELSVGFCTQPLQGIVRERLVDEPAVLAVADDHRLAHRRQVALAELAEETFAQVDTGDGPGYNNAVASICRGAGFEPRTPRTSHGPMAWESGVRSGACVGLTTRSAAASTARGVRLVDVDPSVSFAVDLVRPEGRSSRPAARAFAAMARSLARAGALADTTD
jgi:DNA-binding transcriptional LysR family regulator